MKKILQCLIEELVRQDLEEKGLPQSQIEKAISRFKERGMVNLSTALVKKVESSEDLKNLVSKKYRDIITQKSRELLIHPSLSE